MVQNHYQTVMEDCGSMKNIQKKDQIIKFSNDYNKIHFKPQKYRFELVDEQKKQPNRIFVNKESIIKVIIDCRTTAVHKFRTRLGFKQYVIFTIEQSVLLNKKVHLKEKTGKHNIACQVIGLIQIFMTINLQQKLIKIAIAT